MQIIAVSSAASGFKELENDDMPPLTVAAWRLQATTLVLAPPALYQWRHAAAEVRLKTLQLWWLLMASGACLAAHFGTWVWGLKHTSIPHGLLFVTSSPLLITAGLLVLRKPISRGEVIGVLAGFLGMVLLCIDSTSSQKVRSVPPAPDVDTAQLTASTWILRIFACAGTCYEARPHARPCSARVIMHICPRSAQNSCANQGVQKRVTS
jgi:drug/metabolite transporter (DMT)-like permease